MFLRERGKYMTEKVMSCQQCEHSYCTHKGLYCEELLQPANYDDVRKCPLYPVNREPGTMEIETDDGEL